MTAEAAGFSPHRAWLDVPLAQFTNRVKQQQTLLRTALRVPGPAETQFLSLPPSPPGARLAMLGRDAGGKPVAAAGQGTHSERHVQEAVRGGGGGQAPSGRRTKGEDAGGPLQSGAQPEARAGRRGGHLRVSQKVVETDAANGRIGLEIGSLVPKKETSGHGGSGDGGEGAAATRTRRRAREEVLLRNELGWEGRGGRGLVVGGVGGASVGGGGAGRGQARPALVRQIAATSLTIPGGSGRWRACPFR